MRVVRHPDDGANPGIEVRLDLIQFDQVGRVRRRIERDDGVAHQVGVTVGLEPGEGLRCEPRLIDAAAGDDDDLVGTLQRRPHNRVHDARTAVGQHDRVVPGGLVGHDVVVVLIESLGEQRVGI